MRQQGSIKRAQTTPRGGFLVEAPPRFSPGHLVLLVAAQPDMIDMVGNMLITANESFLVH